MIDTQLIQFSDIENGKEFIFFNVLFKKVNDHEAIDYKTNTFEMRPDDYCQVKI